MTNLAASAVALVVLVDLATGQGPPVYTNYLQQQENYRVPPPMHPVAYVHRNEYDSKKVDKEYEKAIELGKVGDSKEKKKLEKEYSEGKYHGKKDDEENNAGMFSSLSNRMSGAWKSISSFGREKRAVVGEEVSPASASKLENPDSSSSAKPADEGTTERPAQTTSTSAEASFRAATTGSQMTSTGRGMENYEYLQYKNQGYIYFKVPKYLVCGQ